MGRTALTGSVTDAGGAAHHRALERLYAQAPVNALFASTLEIVEQGHARLDFAVDRTVYHAANAAHGDDLF